MSPALPSVASNGALETSSRTFRCASRTDANGETLEYRIVGINHDDPSDGSGKAGLTFETTNDVMGEQRINSTNTNVGGWEKSELRGRLNLGDLWALLPTELTAKIKSVNIMTDNKGGNYIAQATATPDKVFILSVTEVWGGESVWSQGYQYELYTAKGVSSSNYGSLTHASYWWS